MSPRRRRQSRRDIEMLRVAYQKAQELKVLMMGGGVRFERAIDELLDGLADQLVASQDFKTFSALKAFCGDDPIMVETGLLRFLEDIDCDAGDCFSLSQGAEEIGFTHVLTAPVETPLELAMWIDSEHRRKVKSAPCGRCGRPIVDDDYVPESGSEGEWGKGVLFIHQQCEQRERRPFVYKQ